ncbi:MAG: response regulator transcription factor [Anaerolineales bacterium]|nr:response regulator transcription factor [Anaerolineales bacterium]
MSPRILLADDHRIVRQGIRSLLEKHPDMDVVAEAEDGPMAVQLAQELSPDVVVMDIAMPGLNGIVAARRIMTESPDVKVIGLSMHSEIQFVMEMLDTGAAGYLLKDCAFEELAHAIKAVLAGGKYLSPEIASLVIELGRERWKETETASIPELSPREIAVASLLIEGKNTKQIAADLQLSTKTIEAHRRRIFKKLSIKSTAELAVWAIRKGMITIEPS